MDRVHMNLIHDTRMNQVKFAASKVTELTANVITESMYAQCDADGNEYLLIDLLVVYHKENKVISLTKQQISIWGRQVTHKTIAGWKIWCQWQGGSTSWEKLSKLKESHPMQKAQFAFSWGINHEPAFNWLAEHVLQKKDRKHMY